MQVWYVCVTQLDPITRLTLFQAPTPRTAHVHQAPVLAAHARRTRMRRTLPSLITSLTRSRVPSVPLATARLTPPTAPAALVPAHVLAAPRTQMHLHPAPAASLNPMISRAPSEPHALARLLSPSAVAHLVTVHAAHARRTPMLNLLAPATSLRR